MDVITILQPENHILTGKSKRGNGRASSKIKKGLSCLNPFAKINSLFGGKKKSTAGFSDFSVGAFAAAGSISGCSGDPNTWNPDLNYGMKSSSVQDVFTVNPYSGRSFGGKAPFSRIPGDFNEPGSSLSSYGLPFFGSYTAVLTILLAALWICAPVLQSKFGFHRLEKFSLKNDNASVSAMNALLSGEYLPVSAILQNGIEITGEEQISALDGSLEILSPVSYSNYTVKGGDTISAVALRFGLNNISTILSVNEIENARRIRSGQSLKIPSMDGILYTVSKGDSISFISSKFGIPLSNLLDANDLNDSMLMAGQKLFVPGATLSSYDLRKAMGELFIYPIRGRLTSRFGSRADPFTGVKSFHTGVDLAAPMGTSIKVSSDGRVADAGWQNIFGNYVIVSHGGGYQTLYAHMSKISVKRGQYLTQGDEVGKVGSTGYSTGPHLHFSVYKNGKMIDPFSVLD